MNAEARIRKARMAMILSDPFFGVLALRLIITEAPWVKTAATDGKHLFYAPDYVAGLTDAQLQGLIKHGVLHCANGHPWRVEWRDRQLANIAMDYAIDPIIVESERVRTGRKIADPSEVVPDPMIDERFAGLPFEQIYSLLEQQRREQEGGQQAVSDGQQQGEGPSGGSRQGAEGNSQPPQDPRAPNYQPTKGEVISAPANSGIEDRENWRIATIQAAQSAKQQGKLPAGLEQLVQHATQPRVDWRARLRRFVQQLSALDYSWRMPSPRYLASGLYLPRLQSEQLPPIVVVADTSGSCWTVQQRFFAELRSIIDDSAPEAVYFLQVDLKVQAVKELIPGDPVGPQVKGGGGTDFRPAFEWVENQGIEPACLIYLTDLYGTFPDQAPPYPVLWASVTRDPPRCYRPQFGELLYIDIT